MAPIIQDRSPGDADCMIGVCPYQNALVSNKLEQPSPFGDAAANAPPQSDEVCMQIDSDSFQEPVCSWSPWKAPQTSAFSKSKEETGVRRLSMQLLKSVSFNATDTLPSHVSFSEPEACGSSSSQICPIRRVSMSGANSVSGEISMKKIVDILYSKVLDDAELAPFFADIEMSRLAKKQQRQMAIIFSGEDIEQEEGTPSLRAVHQRLKDEKGLNIKHWERFVELFIASLDELPAGVPKETREKAIAGIMATRMHFE